MLSACTSNSTRVVTGFEGRLLPSFPIRLMDSTTQFNMADITAGSPFVVIYFSPYCPHCRAETREMINNMNLISHTRFYMISNFPFSSIRQYYDHFKLGRYPNIIVGQDINTYFLNYYKLQGIPYMAIYNRNKQLSSAMMGQMRVSQIEALLRE